MVLPRIEDPVEKSKFRASFRDKLRFLDEKTRAGNTLEEKLKFLSPNDWEAVRTVVVPPIHVCSKGKQSASVLPGSA